MAFFKNVSEFDVLCPSFLPCKVGHRNLFYNKMVMKILNLCVRVCISKVGHRNNFIYLAFSIMCPSFFIILYILYVRKKIIKRKINIYIKNAEKKSDTRTPLVSLYKSIKDVSEFGCFVTRTHYKKSDTLTMSLGA